MPNQKWYLPSEVVIHNTDDDTWVIVNGKVLNLTSLFEENQDDPKLLPIKAFAGKDISCWFDSDDEFKTYVHPMTGEVVPYTEYGPVLHLEEYTRQKELTQNNFTPWWKDKKYVVGHLTKNPRPLKILNALTDITVYLSVCEEETFEEIAKRYMPFDSRCLERCWFYLDRPVNMAGTLLQNGIADQRDRFFKLGLSHDFHVPVILLKYDDKCTVNDCEMVKLPIENISYFVENSEIVSLD